MSDRRCESCPVSPDRECLLATARHLCGRPEYRARADREARTPELLPLVASCPHRGPVLPVSQQPECGCRELSECRAGRGAIPGRVTTEDCLACVSITAPAAAASDIPSPPPASSKPAPR